MSHSGKRDKGKHESHKKAAHTLKEKRKLKREAKNSVQHPAEVVGKLAGASRASNHPVSHG